MVKTSGVVSKISTLKINNLLATLCLILSFVAVYQWDTNQSLSEELKLAKSDTRNLAAKSLGDDGSSQAGNEDLLKSIDSFSPLNEQDHIKGKRTAKIALIEYSDLECPFCKSFHATMQKLSDEYGPDQLVWAYRHMPLAFHENAQKEAEASECVAELGGNDKFWLYLDKIFAVTTSTGTGIALNQLAPMGADLGINQASLQNCIDSGKFSERVKKQTEDAQKTGVRGTPGTLLIKAGSEAKLISGALPYAQIKQAIDDFLK